MNNSNQPAAAHSLMHEERLGLISGILFAFLQLAVLLFFASFILPRLGAPTDPVIQRAASYAQHGDLLRLGNYLLTLPMPFFLFFLGSLAALLHRSEGENGALAHTALVAGALMCLLWPLAGIISDIGIDIARSGGDAATVASLDAIAPYSLALSAIPRAVLLASASFVLLHRHLAPRWIGWTGYLVGALSLIGSATLIITPLFGFLALSTLLFEMWIVALGVVLLRRSSVVQGPRLSGLSTAHHA